MVTLIFVVTEFTRGAWLVVVAHPAHRLRAHPHPPPLPRGEAGAGGGQPGGAVTEAPVLRNHVVLVLVDTVDLATARAVQLARSLALTGEVRAVHFVIDTARAALIERQWGQLGLSSIPLELFDCPDRRLARAATELVADLAADGETEVVLVLPRRIYRGVANRILHSHTADRIVAAREADPARVGDDRPVRRGRPARQASAGQVRAHRSGPSPGCAARVWRTGTPKPERRIPAPCRPPPATDGTTPIAALAYRQRMRFSGRVRSVRMQPLSGVPTLVCTMVDDTGSVNLVFLGRRAIPGVEPGTRISAEGMVGRHNGQLAVINPLYQLLTPSRRHGAGEAAVGTA